MPEDKRLTRPVKRRPTFFHHTIEFGRILRGAGLAASPAGLTDLCRAMEYIDIRRREDMRSAAQAILVCRREELEKFNRIFDAHWSRPGADPACDDSWERQAANDPEKTATPGPSNDTSLRLLSGDRDDRQGGPVDEATLTDYSCQDTLLRKDLGKLDESEVEQARALMASLISALRNRPARRYRPAHRGTMIDFRKSLRADASSGYNGLELKYRKRRIRKPRIMLLCDVSGSMKPYSAFLLEFIYGLRNELPAVEAGVFSTHMTPVTRQLKPREIQQSINEMSAAVDGWGGGTDIGRSLAQFSDHYSNRMLGSRTVMIILSDGWDRGDAQVMQREIARLRRRVSKLIWLNPLLGGTGYQPLCRGIRCALPHLDHFLPAHNLASLGGLVETLRGSLSGRSYCSPGSGSFT